MFTPFMRQLKPALLVAVVLTVLTGLAYPALITGLAQVFFPVQANGSLIASNDKVAGSRLIGQPFADPGHFRGRPSATAPNPYNAAASSGSNLGPTNPDYLTTVKDRATAMAQANGNGTVPADLVTASGSGLDPDITPAAAFYQVPRVAKVRGMPEDAVRKLVEAHVQGRQFGILGEPRVNVLALNLALDDLAGTADKKAAATP